MSKRAAALGITALMVGLASPALARSEPYTKLVSCGRDDCLLVTGRRADARTEVRINGRPVAVEGGRSWRVRLPVEMVRQWSSPHARVVEVALVDPVGKGSSMAEADLPIGLLGHVTNLASLVVRVR